MPTSISEPFEPLIRKRALALGFDVCGFASVEAPWPAAARLHDFIDLGRHGEMDWMATTAERRSHPRAMWSEARSAVVLGLNYGPGADPLAVLDRKDRGAISVYAQGDDYHELIKTRLKTLGRWMAEAMGCQVRAFVDTAPLMEKPLAHMAGVGWQGKHTNLVSRAHGSWLFLGALLTDLVLEPDAPETDHCGTCRACLDVCPTKAFPAPYQLDARACISYLTIEHKGPIPRRYRQALGNRIYGCDDCLAVCPWNKYAAQAREAAFHPRAALTAPLLADLAALDDTDFRALFRKSPVKRVGRDRFVRNVLYAVGNSGEPALAQTALGLLDDPSPLVRGAAAWALEQLLPAEEFSQLAQTRAPAEPDPEARAEWTASGT